MRNWRREAVGRRLSATMAHAHARPPADPRPRAAPRPPGPPLVVPGAAKRLLRAVHAFLRAPAPEREEAMVAELRRADYLAVVTYDPPLPEGADEPATIPAGTKMHFRGRVAPDGSLLLAVYSDLAAVRKDLPGQPVRTTVLDAERMVAFALHPPHAGAVLNPAGPYLELRAPELARLREPAAQGG